MKKNNSKLKKIVSATVGLMVLTSLISTSVLADVSNGVTNISVSSYDSVTGVTTIIVDVAGITKTYLVADKGVDVSSKTQATPSNVTIDGSIVKYDISGSSISKIYGKTTISYGDFYFAEVEDGIKTYNDTTFDSSEIIENDVKNKSEIGQYDALTSATIAKSSVKKTTSFLGKIPTSIISTVRLTQVGYDNFYPGTNLEAPKIFPINAIFTPVASEEEEGITMTGIKGIEVSIDYDTLVNALALEELGKETALSNSFIEKFEQITDLTTDSSVIGYAKPLLKDGSYGKREEVNKVMINPIVKDGYTKTDYEYGSKGHGEYIAKLYVDGAGMDKETFDTYLMKLSAATMKNNRTGEKDGLFSIHHLWGSSGKGFYVEVAFSKTEGTVHYDGKFKDLSVGTDSDDYTITLMAEGFEDLVVSNINFDKYLSGVTAEKSTFKVSEVKADVVLNLTDIESQFGENLKKEATYTLTKKVEKVNVDVSSYLEEASGNKVSIKDLKALVSEYGSGDYTLSVKTNDYAKKSVVINIENDVIEEIIPIEDPKSVSEGSISADEVSNQTSNSAKESGENADTQKTADNSPVVALSVLTLLSGGIIAFRKKLKLAGK